MTMKAIVLASFTLAISNIAFCKKCLDFPSLVNTDNCEYTISGQLNGSYTWFSTAPDVPLPTDAATLQMVLDCVLMDIRVTDPAADGSVTLAMVKAASPTCCPPPNQPHCADIFTSMLKHDSNRAIDGVQDIWLSTSDFSSGDRSSYFRKITTKILYVDEDVLVMTFCMAEFNGSDPRFFVDCFRRITSTITLDQVKQKNKKLNDYLANTIPICLD